jgi:hypothetical protein
MSLNVERWDKALGKSQFLVRAENSFVPTKTVQKVSGWYADYDEGRFIYWHEGDQQYISWRGKTVKLEPSSRVEWESTIPGRRFRLVGDGKTVLCAKYHTMLRRPWRIVTDLLFPDDDWGLVFDLPSTIHSGHKRGQLLKMVAEWNESHHS